MFLPCYHYFGETEFNSKSFYSRVLILFYAGVPEWSNGVASRATDLCLRRFEPCPLHLENFIKQNNLRLIPASKNALAGN